MHIRTFAAASFIALLACAGPAGADDDPDLQQMSAQRQARCEAISSDRYFTGLIFNPEHLETGYERSKCFQALAEELRGPRLCRLAKERKSWFFDGSGISPTACKAGVAERIRQDKTQAERMQAPHQLVGLALNLDGNGRDIDVHLQASAGAAMSYWLVLSVIDAQGVERVVHQDWQPMDDTGAELMIFIKRDSLIRALDPDRESILRVTLERRPKNLDEQAVYSHLPAGSQSSTLQRRFVLSALKREPLVPIR